MSAPRQSPLPPAAPRPPRGRQAPQDPAAAPVLLRGGFAFAPAGGYAAALATDPAGRRWVEQWRLPTTGARLLRRHPLRGDASYLSLHPRDDGSVLVSWHSGAGQHLALYGAGEGLDLPVRRGRGLTLLPVPAGTGLLALATDRAEDGTGTLYGLRTPGDPWRRLARLPGTLQSARLSGGRLVATLVTAGRPHAVRIDLPGAGLPAAAPDPDGPDPDGPDPDAQAPDGPAPAVTVPLAGRPAHVLTAGGGQVLLALAEPGGHRLALVPVGTDRPPRLLDPESALHRAGVPLHPVAVDPSGRHVLHLETRGARSGLLRHTWATDEVQPVDVPEAELAADCAWTGAGAWLSCATPYGPAVPALLPTGGAALRLPPTGRGRGRRAPGDQVRLESLPGAAGPVEAVVHGPDWRTADRLLIALHGGPNSHWTLRHEPFLRSCAAAGITVVAPNQRGSTGYGAAHTLALVDAWGGPDRDDVAAIAAHLRRHRARHRAAPALYGASYGGYLALLTAMTDPGPWSACVAYAPFLSGPRLHADAAEPVRDMVVRLGGLRPAEDAIGPRDLERLAAGLRTRTLVLHGVYDESVPVAHSRTLARRLAAGHPSGVDFQYEELADRGHAGPGAAGTDPLVARVLAFLTTPPAAPAA